VGLRARAGELIAEGVLAVEMGARLDDLRMSIHPHPSLTETIMEAAEVFSTPARITSPVAGGDGASGRQTRTTVVRVHLTPAPAPRVRADAAQLRWKAVQSSLPRLGRT
jgi:hypothetical protein